MRRHSLFTAGALSLLAAVAVAQAADQPAGPGRGEALVWYLGHCGYVVRTQNHLLVFDYQEQRDGPVRRERPERPSLDNGFIVPADLKDRRVRVFVSHSHSDHFDPVILDWRKELPDVQYYFGWQAEADTGLHCLVGPRAESSSGGLEISTINSHHSGVPEVAWLVRVDGLVIYHNGDCQPRQYAQDYAYLKTKAERVDLAFVMRVYEGRERYTLQNAELFRRFRPRAVLPMHDTAGSPEYAAFERAWRTRVPGLAVFPPRRLGERFVYRNRALARDEGVRAQ